MPNLLARLMNSVPYQAETKTAEKPSLLRRLICAAPYKGGKTAQTPQQLQAHIAAGTPAMPTAQTGNTTNPLWDGLSAVAGAGLGYRYAPQMANQTIGRVPYLTPSDRADRQIAANPSLSHTYFQGATDNADNTLRYLLENKYIPLQPAGAGCKGCFAERTRLISESNFTGSP